jgi:predicted DNA-binding protein (MmcQ/YjbR family)
VRTLSATELRELCLGLGDVTEQFVFNDPEVSVFKVAGKVFAISKLTAEPLRVSVKCDPGLAEQLRRDHDGIAPGYHLNKRHWITVNADSDVDAALIRELVEDSYSRVNPEPQENAS